MLKKRKGRKTKRSEKRGGEREGFLFTPPLPLSSMNVKTRGWCGVVPLSSERENRLPSLLPSFCSPPLPLCLEISTEVPKTVVRARERGREELVFLGASQIDSVESSALRSAAADLVSTRFPFPEICIPRGGGILPLLRHGTAIKNRFIS